VDLEAGGFSGETVEEGVLAGSADDEEAFEAFAGEGGDAAEHVGVAAASEWKIRQANAGRWRVTRRAGETALRTLSVDAVGHAAREQQVGIVDVEQGVGAGNCFGCSDEGRNGPGFSVDRPLLDALAEEPHAVDILVEADAVADGAEVGEVIGLAAGELMG